jgi:hypothetical protein
MCVGKHHLGKMRNTMVTNDRETERQRRALDRVESICARLASSTNVDALRTGLAEIRILVTSKQK